MTTTFTNSNGRTYDILAVTNFNEQDREYYKNSWQKQYVALLQDQRNREYVVATFLGETSWGYGYYADGLKDAIKYYTEKSTGYLKV